MDTVIDNIKQAINTTRNDYFTIFTDSFQLMNIDYITRLFNIKIQDITFESCRSYISLKYNRKTVLIYCYAMIGNQPEKLNMSGEFFLIQVTDQAFALLANEKEHEDTLTKIFADNKQLTYYRHSRTNVSFRKGYFKSMDSKNVRSQGWEVSETLYVN